MARELLAVGLSHHTAPVEVRERMAMDEPAVRDRLNRLREQGAVSEAMLLSTCNRVELYAVPEDEDAIKEFLREQRGPGGEPIDQYLYWHKECKRLLGSGSTISDALVLEFEDASAWLAIDPPSILELFSGEIGAEQAVTSTATK